MATGAAIEFSQGMFGGGKDRTLTTNIVVRRESLSAYFSVLRRINSTLSLDMPRATKREIPDASFCYRMAWKDATKLR